MTGCPTNPDDPPRPACQSWVDERIAGSHGAHLARNAALFLIILAVVGAVGWGIADYQQRLDAQQHALAVAVRHLQVVDTRTRPYAPLRGYEEGQILDRVAGVAGPAVATPPGGEALLHIHPHICNPAGHTVQVRSTLTWVPYHASDNTPIYGSEFTLYAGADEIRPPGCDAYSTSHPFVTPIPVTVATENRFLVDVYWRLLVADTPIAPVPPLVRVDGKMVVDPAAPPAGTLGVRVEGYTEPFRIISL